MKIEAEKWIIDDMESYKILNITKCCDKLIKSENICLNSQYDEHEFYDNAEYSMKLQRDQNDYDGDLITYYEKIDYCPFCGEKIQIEFTKEVDKTEEYNKLEAERSELNTKYRNTDSIRKRDKINEKLRELNAKLNSMLSSDGII